MANAAIREAEARGLNSIAVFVVDASGRTIVSKTMLDCPSLPHRLAHAKAVGCVSTHSSSRALKDKYVPERTPQLLAMTMLGATTQHADRKKWRIKGPTHPRRRVPPRGLPAN